jgi:anti-anti-sigma regulatory factor
MVSHELTVERYAGVTDEQRVLLLRGPLNIETTPHFERAVRNENAETMILDLSDVPYIDSVGLARWWPPTCRIRKAAVALY